MELTAATIALVMPLRANAKPTRPPENLTAVSRDSGVKLSAVFRTAV